jgi:RNA-directed DNA polymerase
MYYAGHTLRYHRDVPSKRKLLGYSFTNEGKPRLRIAPKSLKRFKERIREITIRSRGISLAMMVKELMDYVRGWMGYYCYCQTPSVLANLDSWIRRRIRCFIWKKWKTFANRVSELIKRGIRRKYACSAACGSKRLWAMSRNEYVQIALSNAYLYSAGILPLASLVKV